MSDYHYQQDQSKEFHNLGRSGLGIRVDLGALNKGCIFEVDNEDIGLGKDEFFSWEDEYDDYGDVDEVEEEEDNGEDSRRRGSAAMRKRKFTELAELSPETIFRDFEYEDFLEKMENLDEDGMVKKFIVTEGNGSQLPEVCKVFIHYMMCFEGASDPFDATNIRGYPQAVDLREPNVIPGLTIAIKKMQLGEVAKIWIHYKLAYGVLGCAPRIPPKKAVHVVVELLHMIGEDDLKLVKNMTPEERANSSFDEILRAVRELRAEGNGEYANNSYWRAIKFYRKAIRIIEDYSTGNEEDQRSRQEFLYSLYSNLGQCYLKLDKPQQVCSACQMALRCKDYDIDAKLYFRFAEAKLKLGGTEEALKFNKLALRRDPKNLAVLRQQKQRMKVDDEVSKMLCKKMMGNSVENSSGSSSSGASSVFEK